MVYHGLPPSTTKWVRYVGTVQWYNTMVQLCGTVVRIECTLVLILGTGVVRYERTSCTKVAFSTFKVCNCNTDSSQAKEPGKDEDA